MAKILVIGQSGQLARCLADRAHQLDGDLIKSSRETMDLTAPATLPKALDTYGPDLILNAAAYTAVDQAEDDEETATLINAESPKIIANWAAERTIPFLHVSTDYVFPGDKQAPYLETDMTGPTGAYGRSKLAGETNIQAVNSQAFIFRTAWVYSPYGKNFLLTMLKVGEQRDLLTVVNDQYGNPTSAGDLADALLSISNQILASESWQDWSGLYHLAGTGDTTWADFARKIFMEAVKYGHSGAEVKGIPSSAYPTPTKRPENSRLDCSKAHTVFGVRLPHWADSTATVVKEHFLSQ